MTGESFGAALRGLRAQEGLRQVDLAELLGVARSTLANIERDAERPTPRLWDALSSHRPAWARALREAFDEARSSAWTATRSDSADDTQEPFLAGPYEMRSISYLYVFEEARSPAEIIEIRRVRAVEPGPSGFGLRIAHTTGADFQIEQQALWGGTLSTHQRWTEDGKAVHWRRFDFGRRLRRGEQHEFALRTFIERDPEPPTEITFNLSVPTREVSIHLAFHGSIRPRAAWRFGPLPTGVDSPRPDDDVAEVPLRHDGGFSARFRDLALGPTYGVGWAWAD